MDAGEPDAVTTAEVQNWLMNCSPVPLAAYDEEILAAKYALVGASAQQLGEYLVSRALTVPEEALIYVDQHQALSKARSIHAQAIDVHCKSQGQDVEKWLRCFLHEQAVGLSLVEGVRLVWQTRSRCENFVVPAPATEQHAAKLKEYLNTCYSCLGAACSFSVHHEDVRNLYRVLVDSSEVLQLVAAERPRTPKSARRKRRRSRGSSEDLDASQDAPSAAPTPKSARKSEREEDGDVPAPSTRRPVDSVSLSQAPPDIQEMAAPFNLALSPPRSVRTEYGAYVAAVEEIYSGVRSCRQVAFTWCNVYEVYVAAIRQVHQVMCLIEQHMQEEQQLSSSQCEARLAAAEDQLSAALQEVHTAAAIIAAHEGLEETQEIIDLSASQSPQRDDDTEPSREAAVASSEGNLLRLAEALNDPGYDMDVIAPARTAMDAYKAAKQVKSDAKALKRASQGLHEYQASLRALCEALLHSLTTHRDYLRRVLASCMEAAVRFTNSKLTDALQALKEYTEGEMRRAAHMRGDQAQALQQLQAHDDVYGSGTSTKRSNLESVVIEIGAALGGLKEQVQSAVGPMGEVVKHMRAACPAATCEHWSVQLQSFTDAFQTEHSCAETDPAGSNVCHVVAAALRAALQTLRDPEAAPGSDKRAGAFPSVQLAPHSPLHRPPTEAAIQTPEAAGHPGFSPRTPAPSAPPGSASTSGGSPPLHPEEDIAGEEAGAPSNLDAPKAGLEGGDAADNSTSDTGGAQGSADVGSSGEEAGHGDIEEEEGEEEEEGAEEEAPNCTIM